MADQELRILTTADTKALQNLAKDLKLVDLQWKQGVLTAEQATSKLDAYKKQLEALGATSRNTVSVEQQLFHVQERVNTNFVSLSRSMAATRTTMLSVTQTLQDMPYGIRGSGNNIDMLVQQFIT